MVQFYDAIIIYLDITSLLFLIFSGTLEKLTTFLHKVGVSASLLDYLYKLVNKSIILPGYIGQMTSINGEIVLNEYNLDNMQNNIQVIQNGIKWIEANCIILNISKTSKSNYCIGFDIPDEVVDTSILAQNENKTIITEDVLYLHASHELTNKKPPPYCSTLILFKLLAQRQQISFDDYIDYFNFLTNHRVKFLSISIQDIRNAVFGDTTQPNYFKPANIKKFNFKMTLSEEYGVKKQDACNLITYFLYQITIDYTVDINQIQSILKELIHEYPTDDKQQLIGKLLVLGCLNIYTHSIGSIVSSKNHYDYFMRISRLDTYIIQHFT